MPLSSSLEENVRNLRGTFASCDDIVFQTVPFDRQTGCLVYLSEMVQPQDLYGWERDSFPLHLAEAVTDYQTIVESILSGCILLLVNESDRVYAFSSSRLPGRSVTEPKTEPAVIGPKEAFVEDIHANLRLIRRKIRSSSLKTERLVLGAQTNTEVLIVYISGVADEEIVSTVRKRLSGMEISGVLDSHYVESIIRDERRSPFPTILGTERPDRVAGGLLNGKVAVLVDGSPFVLTAPATFVEFLHAGEDYYQSSLISTALRWVRFLGLFVTLVLPAFYVALITIHQDLLQTPLLIRIAASREALPYPALIEALFLLLTFELLKEAAVHIPRVFGGGTVTILGLVIVGQGAVQAGIIGAVMSIVITVTALTSFLLPNHAFQQIARFYGIILLLLGGFLGFMGILVGLMFGLAYLVSMRSFGVPYLSPVSPARKERWKDVFLRAPWWAMETVTQAVNREDKHGEN